MPSSILRCPNKDCGIVLREKGVELLAVVFPTTFASIKTLLTGNIDRAKCPSCGTIVTFNPAVFFAHLPTEKVWFYVPEEILAQYPTIIDDTRKSIATLGKRVEGEWKVEPINSIEELQTKAIEIIRSVFANVFNDYSIAKMNGEDNQWLGQNVERLNYDFFTSFQLVLEEALPIYFNIAYKPGTNEEDESFKDELLAELLGIRVRFVNQCLINTIRDLLLEDRLSNLSVALDKLIPGCVLDEYQISDIARIVESTNKNEEVPAATQYALEAGLAWAAHKASIPNPRASAWAGYLTQLEVQIATSEDKRRDYLSLLRMPDEFLRDTLDYRLIWDQIAYRFRQAGNAKSLEEVSKEIEPISNLAERLGWGDEVSEAFLKMHGTKGLDKVPANVLQLLFDSLLKSLNREGGVAAFAHGLKVVVDAGRFNEAMIGFQRAIDALGPTRANDATYLVARFAQAFNDSSFSEEADRVIQSWVERSKKSGEWNNVNSFRRIDLMNEFGNAKRYQGRYDEAIKLYKEALDIGGENISKHQRQTLLANLGRVYRDSGQLFDGIAYLKQSFDETDTPTQKAALLHSLAVCHDLLGNDETALELIEQADDLIRTNQLKAFARERARILITKLQILIRLDRMTEAGQVCLELFTISNEVLNDPILFIQTVYIAIGMLSHEEIAKHSEVFTKTRIIAEEFLSLGIGITTSIKISLLVRLAELALIEKDYSRFWNLVAQADKLPQKAYPLDLWRIYGLKSRAALEQTDIERAYEYLQEAWRHLINSYSKEDIRDIPLTFAEDREHLQRHTSSIIWSMYQKGKLPVTYLSLSAELQNALHQNLALGGSEDTLARYRDSTLSEKWIIEDMGLLARNVANTRPIAFLQFLLSDKGYHPLITVYRDEQLETFVSDVTLPAELLISSVIEFQYAVKNYNPASKRDPLQPLQNWSRFSTMLSKAVRQHIPPGSHICAIPTRRLSFLPLHLCSQSASDSPLISEYTFSYVPSIFTAARLRERRVAWTSGQERCPRRFGNFIVWQVGDYPKVTDSFRRHAQCMSDIMKASEGEVLLGVATDATQGLLDRLMSETEILHLCCHGVVSLETGTHRLLISDGKALPPSDKRALGNPFNDPFFLDWDEIKAETSPNIVLSCSCSSGMISVKPGGERVGFERTLFQRGTSSFIAPLWDVTVFDIHPLVEAVLLNYCSSAEVDLSQAVQKAIMDALDDGRATHTVGALALMGDWI